jgi:hypothetical protein
MHVEGIHPVMRHPFLFRHNHNISNMDYDNMSTYTPYLHGHAQRRTARWYRKTAPAPK